MEKILTVNFKEEDIDVLKNAANLLLDLDDAVQTMQTKGNTKLKVDGIDLELLIRLLDSFQKTSESINTGLEFH